MRVTGLTKSLALGGACVAAAFGLGSPAYAATTPLIERASLPYALAYGACIYAQPRTGEPLPDCRATREALLAEADPVLTIFYRANALEAKRSLRFLFDEMDEQAIKFRREDKTVGPQVIGFMRCLSQDMRADADFQRGVFVSGSDALDACSALYDSYLQQDRSTNAVQRNVNYLRDIRSMLLDAPRGQLSRARYRTDGLLTERGPRD